MRNVRVVCRKGVEHSAVVNRQPILEAPVGLGRLAGVPILAGAP